MRAVENSYGLSPVQEGMLFHQVSGEYPGVDVEQIVGVFREEIDARTLKRAGKKSVERHEALRTSFRWEGVDRPVQEVQSSVELPLKVVDWRHLPADVREERFSDYLRSDRIRAFDLTTAPLFRMALFRWGAGESRLLWTIHHIIIDGRSLSIVLRDVFAIYDALRRGESEIRLQRPRAYENHIRALARRDRTRDEHYWRQRLEGFEPPSPLPVARPASRREAIPSERRECEKRLGAELSRRLRALVKENALTSSTLIQGAWAILLSRYTGEEKVIFGATRAGRGTFDGSESVVGSFINTLPVPVRVDPDASLLPWLQALRQQAVRGRRHEHTPLVDVQRWSGVPAGSPLFDTIVVFDHERLDSALKRQGGSWATRDFRLLDKTNYGVTLYAYGEPDILLNPVYDAREFEDAPMERLLSNLATLLAAMADDPSRQLKELQLVSAEERARQIVDWNQTAVEFSRDRCIHELFEEQVERSPDDIAIVLEDRELTYADLNARANDLARRLVELGVGSEVLVGLCVTRSLEMVIGLLGILKAGGAYVPLDPEFPPERLAFMMEDADVKALVTENPLSGTLPPTRADIVLVDAGSAAPSAERAENLDRITRSSHLAYVIYTSGSTGEPKGVMIEHRSVVNFFVGMDDRIPHEPPGVWLAVTSLSFDISVLEILWTLTRGFKVVIQGAAATGEKQKEMEFSLFYFASGEGGDSGDRYRLLLDGAKFADRNGFAAVWTPERHFHAFGGLYPNPSVAGAAIASITERVRIMAGSVVLPLHSPVRVAEEWALVDNLSRGRVAISFASGWQPNDFVLAPGNYLDRTALMYENIETVRKLWRGEAVEMRGPKGPVAVRTLPRPIQPELPIWVTTAGDLRTYRSAGAIGANVLTHLLGQDLEELGMKIQAYRDARREGGHEGQGHVTLMLHTLVGRDVDEIRELVRGPMKAYLRSSMSLVKEFADAWTAFSDRAAKRATAAGDEFDQLSPEDTESLVEFAFERYFETSGLFGTPGMCLQMVRRLREIGVDEIACLIDFGVETEIALDGLRDLKELRDRANAGPPPETFSISSQIGRHGVTHLQCTPSQARLLLADPETREALGLIQTFLVGGEALPADLGAELRERVAGTVINMYGPTETTVWSTTHEVDDAPGAIVGIGRPIANTDLHVLDANRIAVPVGVPGELYIGGDGVARGYFNREELTAQRFVPHPVSDDRDRRVYRTGDLVRYREDGSIEFIGRTDFQVKIRGHRIELGEVEAVLAAHDAVRESVVVARDDPSRGPELIGYYVPVAGVSPTADDLKTAARRKLPEYMVPAVFVELDAIPLTPNGKVDRKRLPSLGQQRSELDRPFVAPRTDTEDVIGTIFGSVIGYDRVGVDDNFFELGGNSLTTIQIAVKIRDAFDLKLPLHAIFESPTVAALAETVDEQLLSRARPDDVESLFEALERLSDDEARSLLDRQ